MIPGSPDGKLPNALLSNVLLNALSAEDRNQLDPSLRRVELKARQVLEPRAELVEHLYFPETAVASVRTMSGNRQVEIGVVGREGMTGITTLLGEDRSQNETSVQIAGMCLRVSVRDFHAAMEKSPTLRPSLLRYVHSFLVQSARTALANGGWKIEERLARRLLLVHDRIAGDTIHLTHVSLAGGLGVTRPGVTLALHILEERGVIRARRSEITVLDREALKAMAGGSYGALEEQHRPAKFPGDNGVGFPVS